MWIKLAFINVKGKKDFYLEKNYWTNRCSLQELKRKPLYFKWCQPMTDNPNPVLFLEGYTVSSEFLTEKGRKKSSGKENITQSETPDKKLTTSVIDQ